MWRKTWDGYPLAIVSYYFDDNLPEEYKDMVVSATEDIEEAAPGIKFMQDGQATNRIRIFMGKTSYSFVGMKGGEQDLQLASDACKGDIVHEFMHALGFLHEHQRPDRDQYVICTSNDTVNYGKQGIIMGQYDTESIMHYYDVPGILDTRNSPKPYKRERLSNGDKTALNQVYPPARRPRLYDPKKGSTGLYYCGRPFMENSNAALGTTATNDRRCGPDKGANCISCQLYGVRVQTQWNKWLFRAQRKTFK